ncbi:efflux RND transporter periplasmic adaptor subunit [Planctomycetaceae bacterium SH139]
MISLPRVGWRKLFWAVVAMLTTGALIYALLPQPLLVDLATVTRGPLQVTVADDGITRIRERYVVSTPLAGRLLRVTFDVGDNVVAGDTVLARMQPTHPDLLDPRAVAQARARVSAAEKRLAAAQAELARTESALDFAEREVGRLRRLSEQRAAGASELEQAEYQYRARLEEVRVADFNVDIAQYELQLQRAALLLTANSESLDPTPPQTPAENPAEDAPDAATLDDSAIPNASAGNTSAGDSATVVDMELPILAPITGRILRLYQESSAVLAAGAPLMELGDPTDLEVVVDALSQDAVQIKPNSPVSFDNWGREQRLRGRVRRVEPSGFTKVSALGVEEQRVNVIIDILDPVEQRLPLGDNFRIDANIVIWQADDVLQIPTSALFRWRGQWHVFVFKDGVAKQVPVEVGENNGLQAQIVRGVEAGEQVIVYPGDAVADGSQVAPRPQS